VSKSTSTSRIDGAALTPYGDSLRQIVHPARAAPLFREREAITLLALMANDKWEDFRATNRANWDERVAVHLGSRFYDLDGWLRDKPGPSRRDTEALGDVTGLSLLHLQCHFGLDTLAWAWAGAQVTGLDFAPAAVTAARDIAQRAGLAQRAEFVCADVYEAVDALGHAEFDIVYVSLGALCWLPSVERWAAQVGALVAPGGRFYLHDGHPLAWALADDRPELIRSYFEEAEPLADDSGYTYTDSGGPMQNKRQYEWNHGVGETVSALVRHGLRLEWLVEHDWTVWPHFPWLVETAEGTWSTPPGRPRLPLSFRLLASRAARDKVPE
jgi:SAM-dependent methyltransferase